MTVLDWLKTNLLTAVFVVLMVAAVVAMPIFSSQINGKVQKVVKERVGYKSRLEKLKKQEIVLSNPDGTEFRQTGLINEPTVQVVIGYNEAQRGDAEEVVRLALEHNQKGRDVLMPGLFPEPPVAEAQVLPRRFYDTIRQAYLDLLEEIRAGAPPDVESVREAIRRVEAQFRENQLKKRADDPLTEEEQAELTARLTSSRLGEYQDHAQQIGIYVSLDQLAVPYWDQANQPTLADLFRWQWDYWIQEDLLRALARANEGSRSVLDAPVKRVIGVSILGSAGGGEPSGGGGAGGGFGGLGSGTASPPRAPAGAAGTGGSMKPDYAVSFTGRQSNKLYDVQNVEVTLVVDTARIPQVLDAIAQQNFMTVLDLRFEPLDPFLDVPEGYFYGVEGSERLSVVTLLLETVWIRDWITPYMPAAVKQALGIPVEQPQPEGTG